MKERNKAVRKAWEREQQLVKEGCGTRDWTEEQQKDILDPAKGKAYDDQGRAFEGQHMKTADSVEQSNRAMPSENDVPGHKQRYHTKKGVV